MRIISGQFHRPMRCPKCNSVMLEFINSNCGTNYGDCDCGYSYDDDHHDGRLYVEHQEDGTIYHEVIYFDDSELWNLGEQASAIVEGRPAAPAARTGGDDVDEFYKAPRPKDEQEDAAWWEQWRNAHPEIPDPRVKEREWQAYLDEKMGLPPTKKDAEIVDKSPPS